MHRDREWRRYQRQRKIQKVYEWMRDRNWYIWSNPTDDVNRHAELMRTAKARHSAPKTCSGWCCGNPRTHWDSDTLAERRFLFECAEEFDEYDIRKKFNIRKDRW